MTRRTRGGERGAAAALAAVVLAGCGTQPLVASTLAGSGGDVSGPGGGPTGGGGGASSGGGAAGGVASGPVDFCAGCALQAGCQSFANGQLLEASGLAPSAVHDGAYYTHNDSGDAPRFFATNCAGDDLGTYSLMGASAVDWEDMEAGPCDGKRCLYFADIGDNDAVRSSVAIYRALEPASLSAGAHVLPSEKVTFTYPDGAHDAEALLVHPQTGAMVIVTKVTRGASGVYRFPAPFTPGATVVLEKAGEVAIPSGSPRVTSGAAHPGARGVLLRTYTSAFFFPMAAGQTIEQALAASACDVPVMLELQGESISFTAKGDGYVTASEQSGQSLHFVACK